MPIKLIAGLRNPGAQYNQTRHNAGEWFIQNLALEENVTFRTEKNLQGETGQLDLQAQSCKLFLPLTFMNHSGQAIRAISQFYRLTPEEILIVHDELDLPPGDIRLKTGGGHGGHNGLRDIIAHLGSNNFHRLRIGIGHPGHKDKVMDYVLHKPASADKRLILDAFIAVLAVMPLIIKGDIAAAMNQLHTK